MLTNSLRDWGQMNQVLLFVFICFSNHPIPLQLFFFFFLFLAIPRGLWDLSSQPGNEPRPPQWNSWVLTTGPSGNFPCNEFYLIISDSFESSIVILKVILKIHNIFINVSKLILLYSLLGSLINFICLS